jgi:outer membrane protein
MPSSAIEVISQIHNGNCKQKALVMNTLLRHSCIVTVLLGLLAATPLQAQVVHIGFVKTERIFKEASSAKAAEIRLTQEFSKREREIADRGVAFKSDLDKFQFESSTLSETQRLARQKQLADQDHALQIMRRNFQEDLQARKSDELQLLLTNANRVIKQLAETEKYDFIFQDAVYVDPKYDLTDRVIKTLNAQDIK